jgi:hypothetical protein
LNYCFIFWRILPVEGLYCKRPIQCLGSGVFRKIPPPPLLQHPASVYPPRLWCGGRTIEIDTLEYQQTEKIETELKAVDRIRAYRCTQLCPGCPSGASHSHTTIYYYPTADSPPLRILPRWRVLYRITRQLLHRARCGSFSQKQLAELSRLTPSVSYCSVSYTLAGLA